MPHANQTAPALRALAKSLEATPLERAVAAAQAYMPTYDRLSEAHDRAHDALPDCTDEDRERIKAAREAVEMPGELRFIRAPSDHLVQIKFIYADGSTRVTEGLAPAYTPDSRVSLEKHCEETGLNAKHYLDLWDEWRSRQDEAEEEARGPEAVAALYRYEKSEAAWERALSKRRKLATAVLDAPVASAEEALLQIKVYRELEEIVGQAPDHEDSAMMLEAALRALASLASEPDPQRMVA